MFALSFGAGLAVFLVMVAMSSTIGAMNNRAAAYTRTDTVSVQDKSPESVPASALVRTTPERGFVTLVAPNTPVPGAVPEPPRSRVIDSTLTLEP
jgi:hypothetical protein